MRGQKGGCTYKYPDKTNKQTNQLSGLSPQEIYADRAIAAILVF
jgi:hypothetical protein